MRPPAPPPREANPGEGMLCGAPQSRNRSRRPLRCTPVRRRRRVNPTPPAALSVVGRGSLGMLLPVITLRYTACHNVVVNFAMPKKILGPPCIRTCGNSVQAFPHYTRGRKPSPDLKLGSKSQCRPARWIAAATRQRSLTSRVRHIHQLTSVIYSAVSLIERWPLQQKQAAASRPAPARAAIAYTERLGARKRFIMSRTACVCAHVSSHLHADIYPAQPSPAPCEY
jgi:hypothetical protein